MLLTDLHSNMMATISYMTTISYIVTVSGMQSWTKVRSFFVYIFIISIGRIYRRPILFSMR